LSIDVERDAVTNQSEHGSESLDGFSRLVDGCSLLLRWSRHDGQSDLELLVDDPAQALAQGLSR
jgi:hypothetical protein